MTWFVRSSCVVGMLLFGLARAQGPVKFSVNLVEVDAVVTDSHGNHIDNLTSDQFEVLQDGKSQKITHFQYVPAPGSHGVAVAKFADPMATGLLRQELHRTFAVFIDDAQMSFPDHAVMRAKLLKFVDQELQEGDLWAFYKTSGGSGAWQTFSSDRREIRSAVEHIKWLRPAGWISSRDFYQQIFETQVTRAISSLGSLPGRKIMVLLNSGSQQGIYPGSNIGSMLPTIQTISDAANRASVTIEAIDLRGLPVGAGMPNSWEDSSFSSNAGAPSSRLTFVPREQDYLMSQSIAQSISQQTGGLFLHDRNDLYNELKVAENDDAGYYLIGWDPGTKAFQGKRFNNLKIKVHSRGLSVRSRAGFFPSAGAVTPAAEPSVSSRYRPLSSRRFAAEKLKWN